jgi:uroporphyrinogen-III synthase
MRRVLVLRPEPGASATVRKARQRGLDAIALPLFEVAPIAWNVPDPSDFDGLLLTSANALRHGGEGLTRLRGLPAHAVGHATAEAARTAGFVVASAGDAGVDSLVSSVAAGLKLLHLCGEDRKIPENAGPEITSVVVYRSRERRAPDISVANGCVALIHSSRAGKAFARLIDQAGLDRSAIAMAAISPAAVEAVGGGWEDVGVAGQPSDDVLLALVERLCNKPAT